MDWSSVNFDWNRARAFLVTAEEGSLSAAARALGMAQPTLGRQVAALEEELGIALFERAGRGVELTPGGVELVEHVRAMGAAAARVSLSASGQSQSLEGRICISASEIYSMFLLPPILARLRRLHPGIEIEIHASNAVSDLQRREADIALRNTRPTQPDLVSRKVCDDTARLYATPGYLRHIGNPRRKADFSNADFMGFEQNDRLIEGLNSMGFALTGRNFPITSANHLALWAMARQGMGIGVVPSSVGDADPDVVRVLPDMEPIIFPIWLTSHRELKTSARVRVVYDFLAEALTQASRQEAQS